MDNTKHIIALSGFIGSGKDTVADYLVNFMEFKRVSFAGTLKDSVAAVFGWDREMLEGRTKESRTIREQVDTWWANRLNMPHLTPRWVLQYWGTDVCRHGFHDDLWIASLENKIQASKDNIVITDCRFPNEVECIRRNDGKVVWIRRGMLPDWYSTASRANSGDKEAIAKLAEYKIHASETAWAGTNFDAILDNNSTIDDLYTQVRQLVT